MKKKTKNYFIFKKLTAKIFAQKKKKKKTKKQIIKQMPKALLKYANKGSYFFLKRKSGQKKPRRISTAPLRL